MFVLKINIFLPKFFKWKKQKYMFTYKNKTKIRINSRWEDEKKNMKETKSETILAAFVILYAIAYAIN